MGGDTEALGHLGNGIPAIGDLPNGFFFKFGGKTRGAHGLLL